ncbi:MAG: 2-C-methyl-D-erythritol 4-phosphate cytidylyltransferase [Chloroflexi bacterium]|nr:MAG: 2-C-methyl-D-erythritol 4-phosphate cytidylyltransferase [Chloroflexota bacterium]TMG69351.1 MAG: 2-C-methyl-D-erythritol 4-phosphate cytidylyltransferase [Chloroflexota bacterium]
MARSRLGAACAILAAGSSTRAGTDKVAADLGGQPVLAWSLAAAVAAAVFERIVVVTRTERLAAVEEIVRTRVPDAIVVGGGDTRTASSWAALDAAPDADVIAIHDSARPFAPPSLFVRCVESARKNGSAVAGLPLADTVRRADEAGTAIEELAREGLWSAQTPQAFRRELLERARQAAGDRSFADDAAAVRAAGAPVRMVLGEPRNLKITTIEDLGYARELVAKGVVGMPALQVR